MMQWVKLQKYCDLSGDTPDAVYAKRRRGLWRDGVHLTKAADGCLWVNLHEVDKWVEASKNQNSPKPWERFPEA